MALPGLHIGPAYALLRTGTEVVRPIAVGETLRRLTSKVTMGPIKERAATILAPVQFGVAVAGGAEAIVHAACHFCANTGTTTVLRSYQLTLQTRLTL